MVEQRNYITKHEEGKSQKVIAKWSVLEIIPQLEFVMLFEKTMSKV